MTTSLVTGGAGFWARTCPTNLLRRGHRVICVDNLETGSPGNIEHLRDPAFVYYGYDIVAPYEIDEPVDFVYHLASPASPIDYLRLPLHTLTTASTRSSVPVSTSTSSTPATATRCSRRA